MKRLFKTIISSVLAVTMSFAALCMTACKGEEGQESPPKTGIGYTIDQSKMFGICALPSDLFTSSADVGVTTDQICKIVEAMNVKSVRVWMHIPYVLQRAKRTNDISIKPVAAERFHTYFKKLKEAGVENILAMSHQYLHPVEMIAGTYNGVIPEPDTDEYIIFMEMFEECYRVMSKEFPEITLWEPNNEMDHAKGTTVVRYGYMPSATQAENAPYLYDIDEVAGITADLCYYANRGIKENNPNNELVMPGLCFTTDGTESMFIESLYQQITSGKHPTSFDEDGKRILPVDTNTDHYFNVLNWHPYANTKPSERWIQANLNMYNVAVEYGDKGKKVFLSEFGWHDDFSEAKIDNIGEWYAEALDMLKANIPSLESVFMFRMFNWVSTGADVKDMEKTFGIFTSPMEEGGIQAKPAAIGLYRYFNGADADLNKLYAALK